MLELLDEIGVCPGTQNLPPPTPPSTARGKNTWIRDTASSRFPLIPFLDRVRMGAAVGYLRYHPQRPGAASMSCWPMCGCANGWGPRLEGGLRIQASRKIGALLRPGEPGLVLGSKSHTRTTKLAASTADSRPSWMLWRDARRAAGAPGKSAGRRVHVPPTGGQLVVQVGGHHPAGLRRGAEHSQPGPHAEAPTGPAHDPPRAARGLGGRGRHGGPWRWTAS